jgi:hypothetical protein
VRGTSSNGTNSITAHAPTQERRMKDREPVPPASMAPDSARRLRRARARGLALDARIQATSTPTPSGALWTPAGIETTARRAMHALVATVPPADLLVPFVTGALLIGEWDSARAWILERGGEDAGERDLLAAQYHAFTGMTIETDAAPGAPPPSNSELHARLQAAASHAASEGERAVSAFVALVHELLGPEPDAARDRITLRVELPAGWSRWSARNLRMGDSAFDVALSRLDGGVQVDVEQSEGALPATLILETTVRAPIAAVEIDGHHADLTLQPSADRVIAPVQLVLDAPRTLRIRC